MSGQSSKHMFKRRMDIRRFILKTTCCILYFLLKVSINNSFKLKKRRKYSLIRSLNVHKNTVK